jgi:hypothetical protein
VRILICNPLRRAVVVVRGGTGQPARGMNGPGPGGPEKSRTAMVTDTARACQARCGHSAPLPTRITGLSYEHPAGRVIREYPSGLPGSG